MLPIELHFLRPEWLWLLLPTALMIILFARKRLKQSAWSEVIAPELLMHLMPQSEKPAAQRSGLWFAIAWILGVLGIAGPSWEQTPVPVSQQKAAYVIVMDLSYSMYAEDLSPSRLERTKQKVRDLLALEQDTQIGLVAYAGDAHVVTPLTDDRGTIENLIPALNPSMMPVPGSDPLDALQQAKNLLQSSGIPAGGIIWFTDDLDQTQSQTIEDWLSSVSLELAVIGVGTEAGAPIPLANGGFLKDTSGSIVVPSLPSARLDGLAARVSGLFQRVSASDADVASALDHVTRSTELNQIEIERQADAWADAGYWLIIPWLLILLITIIRNPAGHLVAVLLIVNLPFVNTGAQAQSTSQDPLAARAVNPNPDTANGANGTNGTNGTNNLWRNLWQTPNQQALEQLERDPKAAADLFEDPTWSAIARYQAQEHSQALEQFEQLETQTAADYYNLGNARAKAGKLQEALDAYAQSLELAEN
jgi:Ca-activated chloride channel family protein